ncbi:PREDICTED: uncharacterized protein LOC109154291 [Ipomoea nil]|uniref:uncharacterized protein LOC109154291 n=1 Tax=Ipomoea nil TaxID=35883 RepID=UPI000900F5CA|nr:PREDICTED: uncharacterized protein LOC109154291 [Ipomoea nil]
MNTVAVNFQTMGQTAQQYGGRSTTVPDSAIPFYHSPIPQMTTTFSHGFTERDDQEMMSYDPSTNVICIGMVFPDFPTLKKAVSTYSIHQRRSFITNHKKKNNWKVLCQNFNAIPSCGWTLSARKLHGVSSQWMVTKFFDTHDCTVQYNQGGAYRMCNSALISDLIFQKIAVDPQYKIKHIQVDVSQHYGVDISYRKAWYAQQKCIEMQYGNFQQSYNDLPQFLCNLQVSNPGTIVEMECIPSELRGSEYMHFKYAFWAFMSAIDRFRSCVPVICIDGTHLYNRYKGHLLLACGYTANKEIYPLAYSIVDSENNASWTWFLRLLAEHVFPDYDSMCIVSDRHAGIDAAFKNVRQLHGRVKHRYCLRHLRSNVLTKVSRNRWLRRLIWEAGTAVTTNQFNENMQTIQQNWPNAYNYLAELDEEAWTLCHDGGSSVRHYDNQSI